ncbi:hypothetical protein CU098_009057 [Rhizopus stolonifer]|uniref:CRAL-TRIO domain-containing protein n=1 Tax=Rhizopus stolonifer TaxID=4846 RepID=A0A367KC51_RHIST|nr:hypothetical protein CU098_009057 [Rhizopus stolonifer]
MLSIAKENTVLFNDEYLQYKDTITNIQTRLQKDIELLDYDLADRQDALEYANDRVSIFRILKDAEFSEEKTMERLLDTIQWRKDEKVARITYDSVTPEFFENGFAFFHKQDLIGRPVAVIQMRHFPKFRDKTKTISDVMLPFACLVMEIARQITRDLTRENEKSNSRLVLVSQISIVIDIAKAPFVPIDSSLMHSLKDIVNSRYPGFVGSVYIMNFGWMYQGIWQVAKLVLSEQAKSRVSFISAEEIKQIIAVDDLPRALGGNNDFEWTLETDLILDMYATDKRFEDILPPTRPSRSSSVSSTTSSIFYDAPDFLLSPSPFTPPHASQYEIIQSTYTSTHPSLYGTPGTMTPINAYWTNRQVALRSPSPEPRYFLNGLHLGESFLTSFFRLGRTSPSVDSQALTSRLNELVVLEQDLLKDQHAQLHQIHFPHMLPDNHPQSIYLSRTKTSANHTKIVQNVICIQRSGLLDSFVHIPQRASRTLS